MKDTYAPRRDMITSDSCSGVDEILKKYPALHLPAAVSILDVHHYVCNCIVLSTQHDVMMSSVIPSLNCIVNIPCMSLNLYILREPLVRQATL